MTTNNVHTHNTKNNGTTPAKSGSGHMSTTVSRDDDYQHMHKDTTISGDDRTKTSDTVKD